MYASFLSTATLKPLLISSIRFLFCPILKRISFFLNNALKEPFVIDDFADLVITTSTHMNQLSSVVSNKEKLVQVVTAQQPYRGKNGYDRRKICWHSLCQ